MKAKDENSLTSTIVDSLTPSPFYTIVDSEWVREEVMKERMKTASPLPSLLEQVWRVREEIMKA